MNEDSLEEENRKLKRLVGKLQLEANLKKNLGIQVEKQNFLICKMTWINKLRILKN